MHHISGIIHYSSFCGWFTSLSKISSGFIHVIACVRISLLLRLNTIPSYVHTTFYLFIHLSMSSWAASTFWLLWIMLLWTWVSKYLFKTLLSILLGIYLGVELRDHIIILFLIFGEMPHCFPQQLYHFTFPLTVHRVSISPHLHQHLLFFGLLTVAIPMGM